MLAAVMLLHIHRHKHKMGEARREETRKVPLQRAAGVWQGRQCVCMHVR